MNDLGGFVNRKNKKSVIHDMKRAEIKTKVLAYLKNFFDTFMLYRELSVKQKQYSELWALNMYEELTEEQRIGVYLKQIKKTWKEE